VSQSGSSTLLRVALVVATFVVLAAIGWGVSVGVQVFTATQKAAESKAEAAKADAAKADAAKTEAEAPKPEPTQIAVPPANPEPKELEAEIQARYEQERAKLEKDLDAAAREVEEEPTRVGGEVTAPEKISGGDPTYTEAARRARIQGVVILEAVIDSEGKVTRSRVLKSLPFGLDEKARNAVASWRFNPARRGGEPVAVFYTVTVNFRVK